MQLSVPHVQASFALLGVDEEGVVGAFSPPVPTLKDTQQLLQGNQYVSTMPLCPGFYNVQKEA